MFVVFGYGRVIPWPYLTIIIPLLKVIICKE